MSNFSRKLRRAQVDPVQEAMCEMLTRPCNGCGRLWMEATLHQDGTLTCVCGSYLSPPSLSESDDQINFHWREWTPPSEGAH